MVCEGGASMRKDFIDYVEKRLEHWAQWYSLGNHYGLGYKSESIAHVLMTIGVMIKSTGINSLPCDKEAEEIETLICDLHKQNEGLAHALHIHFLTEGSIRSKAKKFAIDRDRLSYNLDMARQWLAGRLSAKRINTK